MKSLYSVLVACLFIVPILFISSVQGATWNGKVTGDTMKGIKKDAEKISHEINAAKVSVLKFAETKKFKDSSLSLADIARDVLKLDNTGESVN